MRVRNPNRHKELRGPGAALGPILQSGCIRANRRLAIPGLGLLLVLPILLVLPVLTGLPAQAGELDPMRDFPPVVDPDRPTAREWEEPPPPAEVPPEEGEEPPPEPYRLGVGDELQVAVLGQPEMTRTVKVRPDGAIVFPTVGIVHAMARTPEEVGEEIEERMARYVRYPHVDLMVTVFGVHQVFVMGEVQLPGAQTYHKNMSALQAVAQSGGILPTGKVGSVLVLRRTGREGLTVFPLDLRKAMDGDSSEDLVLQPYDIVHVPRTFITNVNIFVDQWFRQMMPPFSLYLEGWWAFNIDETQLRVVNR